MKTASFTASPQQHAPPAHPAAFNTLPHPATSPRATTTHPGRPRRSPWPAIFITLGAIAAIIVTLIATLILSFLPGRDTRTLRHAVLAAEPDQWQTTVELGVGRLPSWIARTGLRLAAEPLDLPPEALAAITAFRSADVGVYRRTTPLPDSQQPRLATALADLDTVMARRGWEPTVSVQDKDQCVRIFTPRNLHNPHDLRACVLVLDREQLVVVSARVDPEPLIELAQQHLPDLGL